MSWGESSALVGLRLDDVEEDQIPRASGVKLSTIGRDGVDGGRRTGSCRSQSNRMGNGSELANEPCPMSTLEVKASFRDLTDGITDIVANSVVSQPIPAIRAIGTASRLAHPTPICSRNPSPCSKLSVKEQTAV